MTHTQSAVAEWRGRNAVDSDGDKIGTIDENVERVAAEPVIPLDLFGRRNFAVAVVAGLLIGAAAFGTINYLPTYLQMVVGLDPLRAGLLMLALIAGVPALDVDADSLDH